MPYVFPPVILEYLHVNYGKERAHNWYLYVVDYYATQTAGQPLSNVKWEFTDIYGPYALPGISDSFFAAGKAVDTLTPEQEQLIDEAIDWYNVQHGSLSLVNFIRATPPMMVPTTNRELLDLTLTEADVACLKGVSNRSRIWEQITKTESDYRIFGIKPEFFVLGIGMFLVAILVYSAVTAPVVP